MHSIILYRILSQIPRLHSNEVILTISNYTTNFIFQRNGKNHIFRWERLQLSIGGHNIYYHRFSIVCIVKSNNEITKN